MTAQEKREQNIIKRSERTIARIEKELDCLDKARYIFNFESAEFHILSNAIDELREAKSQLSILVSRLTNKQKGKGEDYGL